jgi:hypothetical protein
MMVQDHHPVDIYTFPTAAIASIQFQIAVE